jgi:hypothetical protein
MIDGREVFPFYIRRLLATEDTEGTEKSLCPAMTSVRSVAISPEENRCIFELDAVKQEAVVKAPADRR